MDARSRAFARWTSEPLLHFLAIGALLFVVFAWRGGGTGSHRITITAGQIDAMIAGFTRTWQRPPAAEELKRLVDEHVREEIAAREALALGLDRDDPIVQRRLRQKFEFLIEDTIDLAPHTDAELQAWLDGHPEAFRTEPRVTFRQVHLSPDARGAALDADARALRARLDQAGPDAAIDTLGDSRLLPRDMPLASHSDITREFGKAFADALLAAPLGQWTGPISGEYGTHVVLVRAREPGRAMTLAEARPQIERDVMADRRARELNATYERLLARYRITIEERPGGKGEKSAANPGGGR